MLSLAATNGVSVKNNAVKQKSFWGPKAFDNNDS